MATAKKHPLQSSSRYNSSIGGRATSKKKKTIDNKELIPFSMADLPRLIPSMVDGLKPAQRKILFCSFKRNFVKEAKVSRFSGYVSEHSAYHHGEQNLVGTIIGMAQDFVGSNNINLLQPNGQFGTRHQGGKDHASARHIYTRLSPLTRFLFPKDDDILLEYQTEDGQSIEPVWYMPIIPMVLVNGSEGIGTGWSTFVPNYSPKDIIANVKRLLNDEPMEPMDPWYRGFKGSIKKSATKEAGVTYTITGVIEQVDSTTLRITELPIRRWTQDYKEFLESLMTGNDEIKEPFIKDYRERNDDGTVHFEVTLTEENMKIAIQEGLEKKFKLITTITTTDMHLFDSKGVIKKYDTPEQIFEDFFHIRLDFYAKRKRALLDNLDLDLLKLDNKVRFILGVVEGEIIVTNRKRADLLFELKQKGFIPFTKKTKGMVSGTPGAEEDNEDMSPEAVAGGVIRASDYEYLLSMPIGTLTLEKIQQLCAERDKLEAEVEELRKASPKSLWSKDLDALDKELDGQGKKDVEAEDTRKAMRDKALAAGGTALKSVRKKRKNNTARKDVNMDAADYLPDSSKPKTNGAAQKRAAAKKCEEVVKDNEDKEVLQLKEPLAAYNHENFSPDHTEMETESSAGKQKGRKKVNMDDAATVAPQPQERKKRGRKPAAETIAKSKAAAAVLKEVNMDAADYLPESSKPKARGAVQKRAAAKKSEEVVNNNGNEVLDLKERLSVSNLENFSPDDTEMKMESSSGQTKQIVKAPQPQEKRKRGRKPAVGTNAKPKDAAAALKEVNMDDADYLLGPSEPKAKEVVQKRAAAKKSEVVVDDNEDEVLELKECLSAYNFSPDDTAMEAESSAGQAKQILAEAAPQPPEKKRRGRKPAAETNAKPRAAAAGRKRGPTSQKTSAADTTKLTKKRASPVNRKRRGGDDSSSVIGEIQEVAVVAASKRPKRGNAMKKCYVESDPISDESDFE